MADLIDRQMAIDAVEESRRLNHHQDGKAACAHEYEHRHFLKLLRDLPSAQPERPKGKWVEKPHAYGVAYCSLCDYELHTNDTNFCPNCGADMRGDQNG